MVSSAKGGGAVLAFWVIRGNEIDQCSPGNHEFHLIEQLLLAGTLGAQVQIKAALLHGREVATTGGVIYQRGARFCRISLALSDYWFVALNLLLHLCNLRARLPFVMRQVLIDTPGTPSGNSFGVFKLTHQ